MSIASIPPTLWCAPVEAADSPENNATMPVAVIYAHDVVRVFTALYETGELTIPNLRPILSDKYPNKSIPTTVPANARLERVVL